MWVWWLVSPALFVGLTWPSAERPERRPVATAVTLVSAVTASAVWYTIAWEYGMRWQGARYLVTTVAVNVVVVIVVALATWLAVRAPSFRRTFAANLILGWWLSWYPFPWLGELP